MTSFKTNGFIEYFSSLKGEFSLTLLEICKLVVHLLEILGKVFVFSLIFSSSFSYQMLLFFISIV